MITDSKYQEIKDSINKSYSEKFKVIKNSSLFFSFFGNIASIFFAFFFFLSIFSVILYNIPPIVIGAGVVFFLTLFEYIKRYVFDLFSVEMLSKDKFTKQKIVFIITTLSMISLSFFFSLNGAQKLVNNEVMIKQTMENNITTKTDSINGFYFNNYIKSYQEENKNLIIQQAELTKQQSILVGKGWNTSKVANQLKIINNQITSNKKNIDKYEAERNYKNTKIEIKETVVLHNEQDKNNTNIFYFFLLSTVIELIILGGVFYNRYYEFRTVKEYEEKNINTLAYKNWKMYSIISDIIFSKDIKINGNLPSTVSILETIDVNDLGISKKDLTKCFKTFSHLGITETKGPKRLLRCSKIESQELLKKYFKIR